MDLTRLDRCFTEAGVDASEVSRAEAKRVLDFTLSRKLLSLQNIEYQIQEKTEALGKLGERENWFMCLERLEEACRQKRADLDVIVKELDRERTTLRNRKRKMRRHRELAITREREEIASSIRKARSRLRKLRSEIREVQSQLKSTRIEMTEAIRTRDSWLGKQPNQSVPAKGWQIQPVPAPVFMVLASGIPEESPLPDSPGVYFIWEAGEVVYVGKSTNLGQRVRNSHGKILRGDAVSWLCYEAAVITPVEHFYIGILNPKRNGHYSWSPEELCRLLIYITPRGVEK